MHKVDVYLIKNAFYILVLANLIGLLLHKWNLFLQLNILALVLDLIVFSLVKLTIHRYSLKFRKTKGQVKDLLGRYIEDDSKERCSFHDYIKKHLHEVPAERSEATPAR